MAAGARASQSLRAATIRSDGRDCAAHSEPAWSSSSAVERRYAGLDPTRNYAHCQDCYRTAGASWHYRLDARRRRQPLTNRCSPAANHHHTAGSGLCDQAHPWLLKSANICAIKRQGVQSCRVPRGAVQAGHPGHSEFGGSSRSGRKCPMPWTTAAPYPD